MYKSIFCLLIMLTITSCTILHKQEIEQGNIITPEMINRLQKGMTEGEVRNIMGHPILINLFSKNRIDYVYTFEKGSAKRIEKHVGCIFLEGRLQEIEQS